MIDSIVSGPVEHELMMLSEGTDAILRARTINLGLSPGQLFHTSPD